MAQIKATQIAADFEEIIGWPYVSPGSNDRNGIDCSGAFVRSYRKHGQNIYHGSNTIYRQYCSETGRTNGNVSILQVGMALFKNRTDGKEPPKFRNDGIGNMYHIGLVASINPLRIIHATSPVAKVDKVIGTWAYYGKLKAVIYGENSIIDEGTNSGGNTNMSSAIVFSADGNPVKLRNDPSTKNPYIAKIPVGATISVFETGETADGMLWSGVEYKGQKGFMMTAFLKISDDNDSSDDLTAPDVSIETRITHLEVELLNLQKQIHDLTELISPENG